MRIVGGSLKGRIFRPGKSFKARPTTDIAKEALFNILQNRYDLSELKVLDLFSGTGSISFEFASRGCTNITSVEMNFNHYKFIKETSKALELDFMRILKFDAFKFATKTDQKYDLIFADPPFDLKTFKNVPTVVMESDILNEDGIFILEHPKEFDFSKHPNFVEVRKYGKVNFTFFEKK
ncbi:16S rRNA (guanine(966)-N(2))-methyltransferase RsmD [Prolixibacteraceae bacterium JC049]|nr:16S rRNA (guanine(966)-N(2))-methyltransferase RsmD [Prolixibacteraceae bacterium JC049]